MESEEWSVKLWSRIYTSVNIRMYSAEEACLLRAKSKFLRTVGDAGPYVIYLIWQAGYNSFNFCKGGYNRSEALKSYNLSLAVPERYFP